MGLSSYNSHLEMKKEPFNEMYPFLEGEDLQAYYERFRDSESSILLLQGPPGTGKTTFIRGLLSHLQENSIFTTDPEVFHNEGFLIDFMKGRENYLIFEDADAYLSSRENGNKTLHKFLTIGDGLVSRKKKKIIFTTNLQTLTDIDSALTRPGRCHDILQFRPLTIDECREIIVAKNFNINIPTKAITIAELFNTQEKTQIKKKQTIGFV
jgi:ATP-dependent 26S proteasome regulatory subunit